jgi:hypothetical protein
MPDQHSGGAPDAGAAAAKAADTALLRRAEQALTQLNVEHGLSTEQSATLAAIRLRLEGKERASLEDLLDAGKDLGERDPLAEAMRRQHNAPSFEDALGRAERKRKPNLEDLL